jgi:hypothetical protein
MVELLLARGADPTLVTRHKRTPLMIARAADRAAVAKILTAAEKERGCWRDPAESVRYCKAYLLRELRAYESWSEGHYNWLEGAEAGEAGPTGEYPSFDDDDVVYLHEDYTVTQSIWRDENVIFRDVTDQWKEFCRDQLGFSIPEDLL